MVCECMQCICFFFILQAQKKFQPAASTSIFFSHSALLLHPAPLLPFFQYRSIDHQHKKLRKTKRMMI